MHLGFVFAYFIITCRIVDMSSFEPHKVKNHIPSETSRSSADRRLSDRSGETADFSPIVQAIVPLSSTRQNQYKLSRKKGAGWSLQADEKHELMLIFHNAISIPQDYTIPEVSQEDDDEIDTANGRYILVAFTKSPNNCSKPHRSAHLYKAYLRERTLTAHISVELPYYSHPYYMCVKLFMMRTVDDNNRDPNVSSREQHFQSQQWQHQGTDGALSITTAKHIMPIWLMSCIIAVLLTVSGLFSGLNLGLMSLTPQDLEILISAKEDSRAVKNAERILPVRRRGNFLLCTILLGNVLVNATATVMLEEIIDGIYAIIGSTIGIVIFGEIIPQAICCRHGLLVGAKTVRLTKLFMFLTFPVSYPLSKILDYVLGPDVGSAYSRGKILELVKRTTKGLERQEVAIVVGALALKSKKVEDLMTKLSEVFMIDGERRVTYDLMIEIFKEGFTRIPVYLEDRLDPDNWAIKLNQVTKQNVVGLTNIRDFAFMDYDGNMTVRNVCDYYAHPLGRVNQNVNIYDLLEQFKRGEYHIALVEKSSGKGKSVVVGIITLEDIIEEIIQSQIYDEWDYVSDGMSNKKRPKSRAPDFSVFIRPARDTDHIISAQQKIALFQFLSAVVPPFRPCYISPNVLRKLINNNAVLVEYNHSSNLLKDDHILIENHNVQGNDVQSKPDFSKDMYLYRYGKPADYFVLIISGKACLETGKERIVSMVGPFSYFGTSALCDMNDDVESLTRAAKIKQRSIVPDFSLRLVQDTTYMRVTRAVWIAAVRASAFEKQQSRSTSPDCTGIVNDFLAEELNRAIATANGEPGRKSTRTSLPAGGDAGDSEMARLPRQTSASIGSATTRQSGAYNRHPASSEFAKRPTQRVTHPFFFDEYPTSESSTDALLSCGGCDRIPALIKVASGGMFEESNRQSTLISNNVGYDCAEESHNLLTKNCGINNRP